MSNLPPLEAAKSKVILRHSFWNYINLSYMKTIILVSQQARREVVTAHPPHYQSDGQYRPLTFWQISMCFLRPWIVFLVTMEQVGHTTSPRSEIARCH